MTTVRAPYERVTCALCGTEAELRYVASTNTAMRDRQRCFTCLFWENLIAQDAQHPEDVVVVGGRHYVIAADLPPYRDRWAAGFGGIHHTIKFHDGRVRETCNLWHQGEIPERFRDRLSDNAVFLPTEGVSGVHHRPQNL